MDPDPRLPLVLHIEDDEGDAHLVVRSLAHSSCDVRIARAVDGREALSIVNAVAEGEYERPHLILLDLKLPFVSGAEILRIARSKSVFSDVPIVVLTSSDAEDDVAACADAGCSEYVVKPIDYLEFKSVIADLCDRYLRKVAAA
jgi:DNA-binding response OmpR family regulator